MSRAKVLDVESCNDCPWWASLNSTPTTLEAPVCLNDDAPHTYLEPDDVVPPSWCPLRGIILTINGPTS